MPRPSPTCLGLTIGVFALVSCSDITTEPELTHSPTSAVPASAVASNTWIKRADMIPVRVYVAMGAVTVSGQSILYAIAGLGRIERFSSLVQAYNVATNTWTTKAPLPTRLFWTNGAGVIKGKIYVSGGVDHAGHVSKALYMYDPAADTWVQKRSMPSQGYSGVTGVINDQLYVLTSCLGNIDCDPQVFPLGFYRYDPGTDQWASLPTPNSSHFEGVGGTIGGKLYVAGGSNSILLDVYDPVTNGWTSKTPMRLPRSVAAGATLGRKLYVIGGMQEDPPGHETAVATTSVYDPVTDTWTEKAPMASARCCVSAARVMLNGQPRIEVLGGTRPGNNVQYIP